VKGKIQLNEVKNSLERSLIFAYPSKVLTFSYQEKVRELPTDW